MSTAQNLIDQLKDIHVPAPDAGWTPALTPFWIISASVVLILLLLFLGRRYYLRTRNRRYALNELEQMRRRFQEHQQRQRFLNELNMLLRRMAMVHYDREEVAPLSGSAWLTFLDRSGRTTVFSDGIGQSLIQAYEEMPDDINEPELTEAVEQWIKRQL
ncbi:protein of unknown function [Oceanospirillum multiglobuliferum]|uniref:DUF4381 domain-containing protein n=1 Tax=Oceanospirillum multiglobuliferum TaxID=64969 RepID=A0A1T4LGT0_9GAMM|nr:DUF4381 domain-containing protein [Oceanospirillum multiglobuliferum]OPX56665.1 hypothetical protein BTE48_01845 [Oceanospirillum multiglobuliferum]SJZ53903.1 protein of unknown function [Oceanospirillum multiglobuliferum]